jgi:hypothetical protein
MYYEIKVRYEKTVENVGRKKVTETYLADTETCADAETLALEELQPYISGEIEVRSIKQSKIGGLIHYDSNDVNAYLIKVGHLTVDERTGALKITPEFILTSAETLSLAINNFINDKEVKEWLTDWKLMEVGECPILDVFTREKKEAHES